MSKQWVTLPRQKANLWSYHLELDYKPTENILLYASTAKGSKGPGYINGTLAFFGDEPVDNVGYGPEKLRSYEVGFKSVLAQFNASAFYYDYQDFQAVNFINQLLRVLNEDATSKGFEAELVLRPVDAVYS